MAEAFWHPDARVELEELSESGRRVVLEKVSEFEREGTGHDDFDLIEQDYVENDYYRLKIKQDNPSVSYRLLISDYKNKWVIYGLKHREIAYNKETFMDIESRLY